eukprot:TRINITY_DN13171_c0_g1_i1.p1 TRINITY_DN13171_c0_g1~~TRINITY_DN13171_c0_g1_i1.p1  ORF type:complete len:484 (+),score=46.14 TRINITY_DN13171_c0_g1_i1:142-1593(+)
MVSLASVSSLQFHFCPLNGPCRTSLSHCFSTAKSSHKNRINTVLAATDSFVLDLAEKLEDSSVSPVPSPNNKILNKLREACAQDLLRRSWPTQKEEAFRFTDLKFLRNSEIRAADVAKSLELQKFESNGDSSETYRLFIVDGLLCNNNRSSETFLPAGAFAGSLTSLPVDLPMPFPMDLAFDGDLFSALNGIGTRDVTTVIIPENTKLDKPLHVTYYTVQRGDDSQVFCISNPRLVVMLGKGAEVEIVEEFKGVSEGCYWTNSVLQVYLQERAKLSHSFIQVQNPGAVHIKWTFVQQAGSSDYNLVETSSGGRLNRHNVQIEQLGPDTVTEVSTFHLAGQNQTQDLHSKVILNHPRGYSRQLHKCVVTDSSGHAVFDGNIRVNRLAQLTDAGQLSRCLLLAPRATVNVKPNLQIVADDVKCSHGAAISDLEDDQLFYFRARGVDTQSARNALLFSFGAEIIGRITNKHLRDKVESNFKQLLLK